MTTVEVHQYDVRYLTDAFVFGKDVHFATDLKDLIQSYFAIFPNRTITLITKID